MRRLLNPPSTITAGLLCLAGTAAAQQLPDAGTAGFVAFVEDFGGTQLFQVVNTLDMSTFPPVALQGTVDRAANRRSLQVPTETEVAVAFDGLNPFPLVAIPTVDSNGGIGVELVDYRIPGPGLSNVNLSGAGGLPYDLLVDPNQPGNLYAVFADAGGVLSAAHIQVPAGGAPVLRTIVGLSDLAAPGVTRMVIEPRTGDLVVASQNNVHLLSVNPTGGPGATLLNLRTTPLLDAAGNQYEAATNIAVDPNLANPNNLIFGVNLPNCAVGHGFLRFSATGPVGLVTANPFGLGAPMALAPGFHEVAVVPTAGGSVAVFLVDQVPFGTAGGAMGQVRLDSGVPATSLCPSPFGNPDISRIPTQDPVVFMVADALGDAIVAGGIGNSVPGGSISVSAVMTAAGAPLFVTPRHADRPLAVQRPGAGPDEIEVYLPASVPTPGAVRYKGGVQAGAWLWSQPAFTPMDGQPSCLANALMGSPAGAGQGVTAQGFAGNGSTPGREDYMNVANVIELTYDSVFDKVADAPGTFVCPAPATPGTFGARRMVFNEVDVNGTNRVNLIYPGENVAPGFIGSLLHVVEPTTLGRQTYFAGGVFVTELLSL